MFEDVQWAQRYRPSKIDDTVLTPGIRQSLSEYVTTGVIINSIFEGPAGSGKTTAAIALCKELGYEYIILNGSGQDRGIDTVKSTIQQFATTASFSGNRKCIIVDEADNLTQAAQLALRSVIETVSKNCSFILTCNYVNRIDDALLSRCTVFNFRISSADAPKMAAEFKNACEEILKKEEITFTNSSLIAIIKRKFPDFRSTLNELQRVSVNGSIDDSIQTPLDDMDELINLVKSRKIQGIKKWIIQSTTEPQEIYDRFSTKSDDLYKEAIDQAKAYVHTHDFMYQSSFVADIKISLIAYLVKIASDCKFKDG